MNVLDDELTTTGAFAALELEALASPSASSAFWPCAISCSDMPADLRGIDDHVAGLAGLRGGQREAIGVARAVGDDLRREAGPQVVDVVLQVRQGVARLAG